MIGVLKGAVGIIHSIDCINYTARVKLVDYENKITQDLQILTPLSFGNKIVAIPKVNTPVFCIFTGEGIDNGFILGNFFSNLNKSEARANELNIDFQNSRLILKEDGNIEMKAKNISFNSEEKVTINSKKINFNVQEKISINTKNMEIISTETILDTVLKVTQDATFQQKLIALTQATLTQLVASNCLTVENGKVQIIGDIDGTGNLNITGDITASGIIKGQNI